MMDINEALWSKKVQNNITANVALTCHTSSLSKGHKHKPGANTGQLRHLFRLFSLVEPFSLHNLVPTPGMSKTYSQEPQDK